MAKTKIMYKVARIALKGNTATNAGEVVPYTEEWRSEKNVLSYLTNFHDISQYKPVILEKKEVEICPHCNEVIDE